MLFNSTNIKDDSSINNIKANNSRSKLLVLADKEMKEKLKSKIMINSVLPVNLFSIPNYVICTDIEYSQREINFRSIISMQLKDEFNSEEIYLKPIRSENRLLTISSESKFNFFFDDSRENSSFIKSPSKAPLLKSRDNDSMYEFCGSGFNYLRNYAKCLINYENRKIIKKIEPSRKTSLCSRVTTNSERSCKETVILQMRRESKSKSVIQQINHIDKSSLFLKVNSFNDKKRKSLTIDEI